MERDYFFSYRNGHLTEEELVLRKKVAADLGLDHIYYELPGEEPRAWFAGPNLGEPHGSNLATEVERRLDALRRAQTGHVESPTNAAKVK